ncbi:MAG: acyltransferase [Pseudomonadota bacterium]
MTSATTTAVGSSATAAPLDHSAYLARRRFAGLDGVRCLSIVAVVWHHAPHAASYPIASRGFLGVDLFFVLSGYLIVTLLIRERERTGRISLRDFWVRRLLRLAPAYYCMLVTATLAYAVLKPGAPETARLMEGLPIYALYLSNWFDPGAQNLGLTWSLATEEQFYLAWPLIEAFFAPAFAAWTWVGAIAVNQLLNFGFLDGAILDLFGVSPSQHPTILHTTFTPILLGVGLAHLMHRPRTYAALSRFIGLSFAPILIGISLLALLCWPNDDISGTHRLSIHVASTAFIASLLLRPGDRVTRFLELPPLAFIGAISYGIYLYHMFAMHFVRVAAAELGLSQAMIFPLTLALSILIATASYHFLEKRFLRLRSSFRPSRDGADLIPSRKTAPRATPSAP